MMPGYSDPFSFNPSKGAVTDPAEDWDEDDDYEYDDTKPAADLDDQRESDNLVWPDYVGVVSGGQYKLEDAEGVAEYALVAVNGDKVVLFGMSEADLLLLARQIVGLTAK